jgi:Type IV secretion system pilin
MKTLWKSIFVLLFGISIVNSFLPSPFVHADETTTEDASPEGEVVRPEIPNPDYLPTIDTNGSGEDTQNFILNRTIPQAINLLIGILGMATFMGILIASIQMLTAYGNEDKLNRAKTNLRYGIFGFILSILAFGIVSIIASISLPNEEDADKDTGFHFVPSAHALDVDDDIDILLPSQQDIIEDQGDGVSLPGGDFFGEIIPAIITNIMYAVAFLIFIAFMYGGTLLVVTRGNEESVTKAKHIVMYATIALILISLGYAIIYGIATLNLEQDEDSTGDDVFTNTEEAND